MGAAPDSAAFGRTATHEPSQSRHSRHNPTTSCGKRSGEETGRGLTHPAGSNPGYRAAVRFKRAGVVPVVVGAFFDGSGGDAPELG